MTDEELRDALVGLYAYDTCGSAWGIQDEALRDRCREELRRRMDGPFPYPINLPVVSPGGEKPTMTITPQTLAEIVPRLFLSRMIRDKWLSEEALAQGYGVEDAVSFLRWLGQRMECDLGV